MRASLDDAAGARPPLTAGNVAMAEPEPLTLQVPDLPAEGLSLDCEVDADAIGLARTDVETLGQLVVHADVLPAAGDVSVTGVVSGRFVRQCVRCLKNYDDLCEVPFRVAYQAKKEEIARRGGRARRLAAAPPEEPPASQESECYLYSGEALDLAPMLREQILLASPMQPLCNRECLGLCVVCGEDRNVVRCGCAEQRPANPFSVLRDLWPEGRRSSKDNT